MLDLCLGEIQPCGCAVVSHKISDLNRLGSEGILIDRVKPLKRNSGQVC
jgi:hypothetical protein